MTDQQILGVTASSNAGDIKKALIQKISNLDFENDIENILNYVNCSRRLIEKGRYFGNDMLEMRNLFEMIRNYQYDLDNSDYAWHYGLFMDYQTCFLQ